MTTLNIQPRLHFRNQLLMPASLFNLTVPEHLSSFYVRSPIYVSYTELQGVMRGESSTSGQLIIVGGYTYADVTGTFPNPSRQWRRTGDEWHFQGGGVCLNMTLGIYVREEYRNTGERFSVIMSHELLHVKDEVDILYSWLAGQIGRHALVRDCLRNRQPMSNTVYQQFVVGGGFSTLVRNTWATEHNRRRALHDNPREYRRLQDRLDAIQRRG
ncbi:MAG: hypothetical protein RIK87_18480 [Fuerstiella sp.]